MSNISLHPKYGVNPTVGVCFWCGKDDGTVGLLGFNKNKEAKHRTILTMDPCPTCRANMALGITVFEAVAFPQHEGHPEVAPGVYPTGRWCVVKRESGVWEHITEPVRSQVLRMGKTFMEPDAFVALGFADAAAEKEI
jgi:hypothetical protein